MSEYVRLGIGLVILATIAVAVLSIGRVGQRRAILVAGVRAVLQLSLVALALRGVFAAPAVRRPRARGDVRVATWTATRRLRGFSGAGRAVALACAAGAVVAVGLICGLPVLDRSVRTLVRRLRHRRRRHDDGGDAHRAAAARRAAAPARRGRGLAGTRAPTRGRPVPDRPRPPPRRWSRRSTRPAPSGWSPSPAPSSGALLGGASAVGAARFQVVVLVGLLCAESITAVSLAWLLGAPATLPKIETTVQR